MPAVLGTIILEPGVRSVFLGISFEATTIKCLILLSLSNLRITFANGSYEVLVISHISNIVGLNLLPVPMALIILILRSLANLTNSNFIVTVSHASMI